MTNINVSDDINRIKQFYYDEIINQLQYGWIDYLDKRTMNEWLIEDDDIWNEDDWEQWEIKDKYDWYNHCWLDWLKINYNEYAQYPKNIYQHIIWNELLVDVENKIQMKLTLYIILISFGFYITN